jgi:hypothetical protein
MSLGKLQTRFGRVFTQRCFLLFAALIVLVLVAPFIGGTFRGRLIINAAQALVLIASIAAVGRSTMPFGIGLLLGIPAVGFLFFSQVDPEDAAHHIFLAQAFFFAFYIVVVGYLLRYVFNPEVMTEDKLFGAAACYMMLGIVWAYAYNLLLFFEPQSIAAGAGKAAPTFYDLLFMSFGVLTSNGPASSWRWATRRAPW